MSMTGLDLDRGDNLLRAASLQIEDAMIDDYCRRREKRAQAIAWFQEGLDISWPAYDGAPGNVRKKAQERLMLMDDRPEFTYEGETFWLLTGGFFGAIFAWDWTPEAHDQAHAAGAVEEALESARHWAGKLEVRR